MFPIDKHTVAVYAGHSELAENCLTQLRRELRRERRYAPRLGRDIASETFREMYKTYVASKKWDPDELPPLYVLIGTCDEDGRAELSLFEYHDSFRPKLLNEYHAIGWPKTIAHFKNLLDSLLEEEVASELSLRERHPEIPIANLVPMPIRPEHVAMMVAASLRNIIEAGLDGTIGGKVQCAVITSKGVSLPEFAYTSDPTNEGSGFTRATPKPSELRSCTGMFGCYDLIDSTIAERQ